MQNQQLRQRIEQLFGLPAMKMPWTLYLGQLNEAGKLTARSIMDIMTVVLTSMEEQEEKIKDLELLTQRVENVEPIVTIPEPTINITKTATEVVAEETAQKKDKELVEPFLDTKLPEELQEPKV